MDFGGNDDGFGSCSSGEWRPSDRRERTIRAETESSYGSRCVIRNIEKLCGRIDSDSQYASTDRKWRAADRGEPAGSANRVAGDFSVAKGSGIKEFAEWVDANAPGIDSSGKR